MNKGLKIAIGALVIGFALHNIGNLETKEETRYNAFIDHPYAGMNAEDINNTKLGKPHEIFDLSQYKQLEEYEQYDAKWYFEDDKDNYRYTCTAKVVRLNSGTDVVKGFAVKAEDNDGKTKIYEDVDIYDITLRDGLKRIDHHNRNDFKESEEA